MKYLLVEGVVYLGRTMNARVTISKKKIGVTTKSCRFIIPSLHVVSIVQYTLYSNGVEKTKLFLASVKRKIFFMVPYPADIAPGQRFRFEQFLEALSDRGYDFTIRSFLGLKSYRILYSKGHFFKKAVAVIKGFLKRIGHTVTALRYDYIFIYREATPIGPPVVEWMLHLSGKKIIYDFDDAIWLADDHEKRFPGSLKWKKKVGQICSWSDKVTVGNQYLAEFAAKYNDHVLIIPTVVNTEKHHLPMKVEHPLTIGWTGSHSTLPYLQSVITLLRELHEGIEFRFLIIADKDPGYPDDFIEFRAWGAETEIRDLNEMDIGIMPLTDTPWSRGKCGFKLIQYLSVGIPAVASDVGVNREILGQGGFICSSGESWKKALITLLEDGQLRRKIGQAGREYIQEHYSVQAVKERFVSLFQ